MGLIRLIGNILWFIGGGLISFITWLALGLLLCLTIIGIPFGIQCLKLATLVLAPFGKEVVYGGKTGSFLMNILWLPLGLALCLEQVALGLIYCITIIGIPAGLQAFKMAKLSLMPFGATVHKKSAIKKEQAATKAAAKAIKSASQTPAESQPAPAETTPAHPATAVVAAAQPVSVQAPATSTETDTPQPAANSTTEPTSSTAPTSTSEDSADKKPKVNPVIIIVIVVVVVLLGLGVFLLVPAFIGGRVHPTDMPENIPSLGSSSSQSAPPAPTIEEIGQSCAEIYGGTLTLIGSSNLNGYDTVDSYFCKIREDANVGFLAHVAGRNYLDIAMEEESRGVYDEDDDAIVSRYLNSLGPDVLPSVDAPVTSETTSIFQIVHDNILLVPVGMDSESTEGLIDIAYPKTEE